MRTIMVSLGESGRLVIPAPFRRALGIEAGDELVLTLDEGKLHITTREQAVSRVQEAVRQQVGVDASLVDELIEERHAETRSE